MSLDGAYLLHYEPQPYSAPEPWVIDEAVVKEGGGAPLVRVGRNDYFFEMPKHTLPRSVTDRLRADQVLESLDGGDWKDVTART